MFGVAIYIALKMAIKSNYVLQKTFINFNKPQFYKLLLQIFINFCKPQYDFYQLLQT